VGTRTAADGASAQLIVADALAARTTVAGGVRSAEESRSEGESGVGWPTPPPPEDGGLGWPRTSATPSGMRTGSPAGACSG
jgi:hypothetical protein